MKNFHHIISKEKSLDKTINLKEFLGKRVISSGGKIVGRVSEVRIDPSNLKLQGIIVSQSLIHKPIYIGKGYFKSLSNEAIVLNTELSIFLKGRIILESNGKPVGKISTVVRKSNTNEIKELIVKNIFRKPLIIPFSAVKIIGKSVILKPGHHVRKKYFWQKS